MTDLDRDIITASHDAQLQFLSAWDLETAEESDNDERARLKKKLIYYIDGAIAIARELRPLVQSESETTDIQRRSEELGLSISSLLTADVKEQSNQKTKRRSK